MRLFIICVHATNLVHNILVLLKIAYKLMFEFFLHSFAYFV